MIDFKGSGVYFAMQVTVGEPQSRTKGRSSFVAKVRPAPLLLLLLHVGSVMTPPSSLNMAALLQFLWFYGLTEFSFLIKLMFWNEC